MFFSPKNLAPLGTTSGKKKKKFVRSTDKLMDWLSSPFSLSLSLSLFSFWSHFFKKRKLARKDKTGGLTFKQGLFFFTNCCRGNISTWWLKQSGGRNDAICGRGMHDRGKISIICDLHDKVVTPASPAGPIMAHARRNVHCFFFSHLLQRKPRTGCWDKCWNEKITLHVNLSQFARD